MPLPPKRKFEFEAFDGLFDVYVDGVKVRNGHPGRHGHVYFHIPKEADVEVTVEPHDPRKPVEAEITEEGLTPKVDEAEVERIAAEAKEKALKEAKAAAQKKLEESQKKKQDEKFKNATSVSNTASGAIPKPTPPE